MPGRSLDFARDDNWLKITYIKPMTDYTDAWKVNEKDFPKTGSPADKLAFCVRYAVLAPSTYNRQPWFFRIKGNTLSLYADRRYGLPVIDADDRDLTLHCAAALYNLRLAIHRFGYGETTQLTPDASDEDLLARVRLGDQKTAPELEKELFAAIPKRHMNRSAFADKEVPENALREIKAAVNAEGAWLHVCTPAERKAIVGMVAEGDHIQTGNKVFRRELASWIHPRRVDSGDGMPQYGGGFSDVMNSLSPSVVRRFEVAPGKAASDEDLENGSPAIVILGSRSGTAIDRIQTGQAMQRMLLKAQTLGLSASSLSQPLEVPELRLRLHDEIEHTGRMQMIFRLGYGGKPVYGPRRPLSAVLAVEGREVGLSGVKTVKGGWLRNLLAKRA